MSAAFDFDVATVRAVCETGSDCGICALMMATGLSRARVIAAVGHSAPDSLLEGEMVAVLFRLGFTPVWFQTAEWFAHAGVELTPGSRIFTGAELKAAILPGRRAILELRSRAAEAHQRRDNSIEGHAVMWDRFRVLDPARVNPRTTLAGATIFGAVLIGPNHRSRI